MADKQKYYFVNWIDGMKINKDHFISMENAMIYQQHVLAKSQINPYNFGLLPMNDGDSSLDISYEIDTQNHINVRVNKCLAITSGGYLIDLDTSIPEMNQFEIFLENFDMQAVDSKSSEFYIVLKINPYGRTPVGQADPMENPPRHPFIIPEYGVYLVPEERMNKAGFGDHFQVIGKMIIKDGVPALDKGYIPPCSSVSSDERLVAINNRLIEFFGKLEMDILLIINKIHKKEQKSPLANTVMYICDKMAAFQGLHITKQRLFLRHSPPIAIFEAISQFARLLRNTFNTQTSEQREEMINYFSDWCNLKQGELEKLMIDTVNFNYNHYEIALVMSRMMAFIETMSTLFETISHLEYIGKRRDTQIYIKEDEKPKRSFLAED
jgi:hypothetical protein